MFSLVKQRIIKAEKWIVGNLKHALRRDGGWDKIPARALFHSNV